MKQNKSHSHWLLWITLLICTILIVFLVYGIYLYYTVQKGKQAQLGDIETTILNETELTEIDEIHPFYGEDTYQIVFGKTENNQEKIVFFPESKKMDELIIDQSDMMSEQEVSEWVNDQCTHCEVKQIKPAMIDQQPLWEVTYRDESDRFIFDYLSLYDGTRYEQLQFKQMFN